MSRHFMIVGLATLALAVPACRGADSSSTAAGEPPPPLIEPELAPVSRLVDPRADELVRQMSDRLGRSTAFALEAEEVYDEVPEQSPRQQLTNLRHVAMRRPNRLVGDASGDASGVVDDAGLVSVSSTRCGSGQRNGSATGVVPAALVRGATMSATVIMMTAEKATEPTTKDRDRP